ncbi:MAG: hypothetical protein COA58_04275 [Bacteroidetes bacterium]|nr:MAG: hypothetical protein COA58_04275 [Bacteroidota bacterium]
MQPYVTAFGGPRIYSTGQKVALYNTPNDSEGSTRETITASAAWSSGIGIGAKFRVNQFMYFDARYEMLFTRDKQVVDLAGSYVSGANYKLRHVTQSGSSTQFKLGLIFDLSSHQTRRELKKEGFYKEEKVTYYIDLEDADKIIIPCDQETMQKSELNNNPNSGNDDDPDEGSGFGIPNMNGTGSGGKLKSMPKIKRPVSRS